MTPGSKPRLTERQQRFVEAFAASGNGTQAATKAGYAKPAEEACRLLKNAKVAAALVAEAVKRKSAAVADRDERQQFLTTVQRKRKENMAHRLKACELLGRMQGDFLERHEIVSGARVDVTVYIPDNGRGG